MTSPLADDLLEAVQSGDLARASLVVARIEYPHLDAAACLSRLDALGTGARLRIDREVADAGRDHAATRAAGLIAYLFEDELFVGNRSRYEDPRNSCLNDVLSRHTGIPLTLAIVFLEVARRAGVRADGVNCPGHFLVRCPDAAHGGLLLDPFHKGAVLSPQDCQRMLSRQSDEPVDLLHLMAPATPTEIIVRMLVNLKRVYVAMRSFPQARDITNLLLAVSPSGLDELRDRGLLAFHLNDLSGALRDLETYLRLSRMGEAGPLDEDARRERQQLWGHIKTLRRRTASLN